MRHYLSHAALFACIATFSVQADEAAYRADSHAPIGVMADHTHNKGEWMLSYRFMSMDMQGNLKGGDSIDADTIVTTEPNRFAGMPGMPPTLRVVPLDMQMDMHMFGMMYAPSDRVTLMAMGSYIEREMKHVTYQGGSGTTELGGFRTRASGWGDVTAAALVNLLHGPQRRMHVIAGVSVPTGSSDETGRILTPMNMQPVVRLPYPMQLGSGSWDPVLGVAWSENRDQWGWGAQWRSVFRVSDNDDDYRLGHETRVTAWLSYLWTGAVSTSLRLEHYDRGNISGIDGRIMAPVQTADPARQGIERTDLAFGINVAGQRRIAGWRAAIEFAAPVAQDLDGPQLETDASLTIGIQKAW